jgi:hypothetical protein
MAKWKLRFGKSKAFKRVLIEQPDYQAARKYWNKLKERLNKEGN